MTRPMNKANKCNEITSCKQNFVCGRKQIFIVYCFIELLTYTYRPK